MARSGQDSSQSSTILLLIGGSVVGMILLAICGGIFVAPMVGQAISQSKEQVQEVLPQPGMPQPPDQRFQQFPPPAIPDPRLDRPQFEFSPPTGMPAPEIPIPPTAPPFSVPPSFPRNPTPPGFPRTQRLPGNYPITQPIPAGWEKLGSTTKVTKGTKLQVEWGIGWKSVTVLEDSSSGPVFITWDGYSNSWDEPIIRESLIIRR